MSQGRLGLRNRLPDITVLELSGTIDPRTMRLVDQTMANLVRKDKVKVVVNCEKLESITADGLESIFLSHLIQARKAGGDIKFCAMSRDVQTVVRILDLGNLLTVLESEEEAVKTFRRDDEKRRQKDDQKSAKEQLVIEARKLSGNLLLLRIQGFIDRHTQTKLERTLHGFLHEGCIRMLVDCKGLDYISSTGIGTFIKYQKLTKSRGGDIRFFAMNDSVGTLLSMLGLNNLFQIFDTFEQAVASFG